MGDVEQVLLVEDDHPDGVAAGHEEPDVRDARDDTHAHRGEPRLRRLRRVALVSVGALLLGLVATQLVVDGRERARLARYADVPGVLAPLRPDLQTLWRSDEGRDATMQVFAQRAVVQDVLLTGGAQDDGTALLSGTDTTTGEQVWSQTLAAPGAAESDPTTPPQLWCVGLDTLARSRPTTDARAGREATCQLFDATVTTDLAMDDSSWTQLQAGYSSVVVVDVTTGEVTHRVDLPFDTAVSMLSDGYVTSTPDVPLDPTWTDLDQSPAGAVTIARYRWGSDEPVWSLRSESFGPEHGDYVSADTNGTWTAVSTGVVSWLVDDTDGTVVGTWALGDAAWVSAGTLPGGGALVSTSSTDGGSDAVLVTADGTQETLGAVSPLGAYPDDGSAGGVLLVREAGGPSTPGALAAVDPRTGERVWTSDAVAGWSVVVLDGVVYSLATGSLSAVDASDGAVLWTRRVSNADMGQLLTDGSVLVVLNAGRLNAYDRTSGAPAWSALLVAGDDGPRLVEVQQGPTASSTASDARDERILTDVYVTVVGRHLALETPTDGLVALG